MEKAHAAQLVMHCRELTALPSERWLLPLHVVNVARMRTSHQIDILLNQQSFSLSKAVLKPTIFSPLVFIIYK